MHGASTSYQPPTCPNADPISLDGSIGDLFRIHGEEYIRIYKPNLVKIKLIRAVRLCKTPFLGGQTLKCKNCGKELKIYHSCGHSQCPICQSIKRAKWQDKLNRKLLAVPYIHTVFTIPHELNRLAKSNQSQMYNLLMRSAWKTVKTLTAHPDNLGALPGMVSVLHTFGSDMKYHLHVHSLITFGGLSKSSEWLWPKRKKIIAPYKQMCHKFREIFTKDLEKKILKGSVQPVQNWKTLKRIIQGKRWNVRSSYPTMETSLVENYLSRYINRVAISPNRFKYIKDQQRVQILYKDYKNQKKNEAAPKATKYLDPPIAIHHLMRHVLPPYLQKSRHYGLHSVVTFKRLEDKIPDQMKRNGQTIKTLFELLHQLLKITPYCCDRCKSQDYEIIDIPADPSWIRHLLLPNIRAPTINRWHINRQP